MDRSELAQNSLKKFNTRVRRRRRCGYKITQQKFGWFVKRKVHASRSNTRTDQMPHEMPNQIAFKIQITPCVGRSEKRHQTDGNADPTHLLTF